MKTGGLLFCAGAGNVTAERSDWYLTKAGHLNLTGRVCFTKARWRRNLTKWRKRYLSYPVAGDFANACPWNLTDRVCREYRQMD